MGRESAVLFDSDALVPAGQRPAFGPDFFVVHLRRFLRQECPDPHEQLPSVTIQLETDETIELCHIITLSPRWVSVAVYDGEERTMRTEMVAYDSIRRIIVREPASSADPDQGKRHGTGKAAEELLEAARGAVAVAEVEWPQDGAE